jgi:hypothetical protein
VDVEGPSHHAQAPLVLSHRRRRQAAQELVALGAGHYGGQDGWDDVGSGSGVGAVGGGARPAGPFAATAGRRAAGGRGGEGRLGVKAGH